MNDAAPGASLPLEPVLPPSSFSALLTQRGLTPQWDLPPGAGSSVEVAEATTVLAIRYADGVVHR